MAYKKEKQGKFEFNRQLILVTAIFLVLILLIAVILIVTNPYKDQAASGRGEYDFVGAGTEKDPYLISDVDDLCHFRDLVNSGYEFSDKYFLQANDINLSHIDNWIPIGEFNSDNYFYGSYNGDGHTISNLTISSMDGDYPYNALFGYLCGEVCNLGIESGYIEGICAGSIASHGSSTAAIINCYNKATIHGSVWAGGIAVEVMGRVSYCWNLGEVISDIYPPAGISPFNAKIKNCYSYQLPVVTDNFYGNVIESQEFSSLDEIDINKIHEAQYDEELYRDSELKPTDHISFIVKNGDTISFDRNYTPSYVTKKNIEEFFTDYGALLLLGVIALVLIVIIIKKSPASGTALTFSLILGSMFLLNNVLEIKNYDGIISMRNYYLQPDDSVDVLLLGSSMVGGNQDPEVLWTEYGISSYALWGGVLPSWSSYYFLNEALKCGKPEVVVFDVISSTNEVEYLENGWYHHTYGIKDPLDRFSAIQAASPQERWSDLFLGFPIFHARYSSLTKDDFGRYPWRIREYMEKGGLPTRYTSGTVSFETLKNTKEIIPMPEKQEDFLIKIFNRCKIEDVPLVLVASCRPNRNHYQPYLNYVANLAAEYDVPFINYNLLDTETGITDNDILKDNDHLNTNGARKQSTYLGQYLKEHYDLFDHRGDPYYSSWDEFAINQQNTYIPMITDRSDYLKEIIRDDRTAVIVKWSVDTETPEFATFKQDAANCGFDMSFIDAPGNCCWVVENPGTSYKNTGFVLEKEKITYQLGDEEVAVDPTSKTITYAGKSLTGIKNGITCIVYDPNTETIIDKCLIFDPSKISESEEPEVKEDPMLKVSHI